MDAASSPHARVAAPHRAVLGVARIVVPLVLAVSSYAIVQRPGFFAPRYGVVEFMQGTAHNPFARRALAPWLVQASVALIPAPVQARIDAVVEARTRARPATPRLAAGYGTGLLVSVGWSILELAVFFHLVSRLAALALGAWASLGFAAATALLWTAFGQYSVFIYDPLVMALWAGATLAVVRERPRVVDALVLACALTKETAIALPLAAWFVAPPRRRGRRFALRTAVVVLVQAALVFIFRHRAGDVVETHWSENLGLASRLELWFQFEPYETTVAFPRGLAIARPVGFNLLLWVPLVIVAAVGWRDAKRPVRWATATLVALALPLQVTICMLHEIRDLYEVFPWLLWLIALGLARIGRGRAAPSP
jgi:hypothetical protein